MKALQIDTVKLKIVYPSMRSKPSVKSNDILVEVKAAVKSH
jgi:hypothetical protein